MFSKQTYIERRKVLREKVGSGVILLLGNSESPMNYADNTYHFRQDSTFLYYTGIQHPELALVIDCESGKEILIGDNYTIDDIVWMGQQPTIEQRALEVGISSTADTNTLGSIVLNAVKGERRVHFLPPYRPDNKIKLMDLLKIHPMQLNNSASVELIMAIVSQRNIKTAEEIIEIEKAVNTTVEMHLAAMRIVRPGITEAQVAAEVTRIAQSQNGNLSFPIIATINGQTLHNHYHGNTVVDGKLFLLDCGAETSMGYAGDMSSTFPTGMKFTTEQKEIYNIALAAHEKAISMLAPGVAFKDIHLATAKVITEGMKSMGFMRGNTNDAVAAGAHAMFFPCGLGHMMGLDVHDMEDLGEVFVGYDGSEKSKQFGLKSLRLGRPLEAGNVLTIEPGIYFIPDLIDKWRAEGHNAEFLNFDKIDLYRNFGGCRNEEDFLITSDGARLLGKPLPKTVADVETERAKAF